MLDPLDQRLTVLDAGLDLTVQLHPVSSLGLIAWQLAACKEHRMASSSAEQGAQEVQQASRAYARRMTSGPGLRSHEEFARVLRRAGCSDEFITEVLSQVPDPVDLQRDQQVLERYGLSPERLMDRMGGSP